jgi:hypothetical protein
MKNEGLCGCSNKTKLKQALSEVQSKLFKNQGTHFMLHFSCFIIITGSTV